MDSIGSNSNVARYMYFTYRTSIFQLNFMEKKNILRLSGGPLASYNNDVVCVCMCVCVYICIYEYICARVCSHVRQSARHNIV